MEQTAQLMEFYRMCFNASAAVTAIASALAVFLFFRFDIRGIYVFLRGRAKEAGMRNRKEEDCPVQDFRFEITSCTVVVHTDEIIE